MKADKIYCANCENCKIIKINIDNNSYQKRVKCLKMQWTKKSGGEKIHKFFTVARRTMDKCKFYEPMGDDAISFIKNLKKDLPPTDETYTYPG